METDTSNTKGKKLEKDERLSKRLCYVLRYGAVKEGLTLYEGGNIIVLRNSIHRLKRGRKHTEGSKKYLFKKYGNLIRLSSMVKDEYTAWSLLSLY